MDADADGDDDGDDEELKASGLRPSDRAYEDKEISNGVAETSMWDPRKM